MKIGELEIKKISTKIEKENIYIGNIKRCTKYREVDMLHKKGLNNYVMYNSEIYAKDVILIKITSNPNRYMSLSVFKVLVDYFKEHNIENINPSHLDEMIYRTKVNGIGSIWLDKKSLKPYYENEKGKVKVRTIKRKSFENNSIKIKMN